MQNVLTVVVGYLGKISLPGFGVIDIIEIGLISFFCISVYGIGSKFHTCIYLLKGHFDRPLDLSWSIYLQMNYDPTGSSGIWTNVLVIGVIVIFQPELRRPWSSWDRRSLFLTLFPLIPAGKCRSVSMTRLSMNW